ncbi:hypothetical protein ESCO_003524 [Escovopsis weberi]|uniref:F-box domain-containing protein n=1 Tax=Escovopsis weberi TaxID=150374 RepID=A0A0M9VXD8_ESCWE|nr:hypothetical protein ESCO_003524 [Escovopsis weberi]
MASRSIISIAQLPNELIAHILSFLDLPPFSEDRIYDDPAKILDDDESANIAINNKHSSSSIVRDSSDGRNHEDIPSPRTTRPAGLGSGSAAPTASLKSASLVCRLWRDLSMPFLYRHTVWKFQSLRRPLPGLDPLSAVPELEWLRFLRRRNLLHAVQSLTVIIASPVSEIGEDLTHHLHSGILPSHLPASTLHGEDNGAAAAAAAAAASARGEQSDAAPESRCNNWLWDTIFAHADLATITLVGSSAVLASLLGRPIDLSRAWLFHQRFHIVSLSRTTPRPPPSSWRPSPLPPLPPTTTTTTTTTTAVPCNLFTIRDWTSLLINEGSSVKAYATYEHFTHSPPSLLPALLDASDASTRGMLASLTNLSYVAIFPLSGHIEAALIPRIPSLHRFFIQIVPREVNYAETAYRHPAIDINDFWVERNASYSLLALAVFDMVPFGNWRDLQVFESGDSSDLDAWEQAVRFVVFNAGLRWQVSSNGVFVRRQEGFPTPGLPASGWVITGR